MYVNPTRGQCIISIYMCIYIYSQFESIREMTEDTKKKASQITGELQKSKNQLEQEGEGAKQLIKRVKNFLLGNYGRENVLNGAILGAGRKAGGVVAALGAW